MGNYSNRQLVIDSLKKFDLYDNIYDDWIGPMSTNSQINNICEFTLKIMSTLSMDYINRNIRISIIHKGYDISSKFRNNPLNDFCRTDISIGQNYNISLYLSKHYCYYTNNNVIQTNIKSFILDIYKLEIKKYIIHMDLPNDLINICYDYI